jgi:2-polyprenyl-3-methyl-5-hydroxy-6-metoxy-1,4-benzoquinol methylase
MSKKSQKARFPAKENRALLERKRHYDDLIRGLKTTDSALLWEAVLANQSHLYLESDLKFFFNQPAWQSAKKVLELGCGNGAFLSKLSNYFPEKRYLGVEIDEKNLNIAKERCKSQASISFLQSDIWKFAPSEKYDVIVLRFVLQHLKDNERLLPFLKSMLSEGGCIFVVDACDHMFLSRPAITSFRSVLDQIKEFQDSHNQKRNASFELLEISERFGYKVVRSEQTPCPIFRDADRTAITELIVQVYEVLRRLMQGSLDEDLLSSELAAWFTSPYCYLQLGLHQLVIGKK